MCVFRGDRWIGIIKLCHIVYRVSKWALEKLRVVVVVVTMNVCVTTSPPLLFKRPSLATTYTYRVRTMASINKRFLSLWRCFGRMYILRLTFRKVQRTVSNSKQLTVDF